MLVVGHGLACPSMQLEGEPLAVTRGGGSGATGAAPKYGSYRSSIPGTCCTYLDADPSNLQQLIEGVTVDGDCIMFSRTSDAGVLHVRILSNGAVEKFYLHTVPELEEFISGVLGIATS